MLFKATYKDGSHCQVEATGWALAAQIALSKQPVTSGRMRAELVKLELDVPGCAVGVRQLGRSPSPAEA